jgi:hypothetical protein
MTALDHWLVFAVHVVEVDGVAGRLKRTKEGGVEHIHDDCREMFLENVIEDVSTAIIEMASADGNAIPFRLRAGALDTQARYRARHLAMKTAERARSLAGVLPSGSSGGKTQEKDQGSE